MLFNCYEWLKLLVVSEGRGIVVGIIEFFVVYLGMDVFRKGGNVMDVCLVIVFVGIINVLWKFWWIWWGILGEEFLGEEFNLVFMWLRFDGKNYFIGMNNFFYSIVGFFYLV